MTILFHSWHTWIGYSFLSLTALRDVSQVPRAGLSHLGRYPSRRDAALFYYDYYDRHYIKAYLESWRLAMSVQDSVPRATIANDRDEG